MESQFILALVMAAVAFVLTLVFGKQFGAWLGTMGAAVVMVPLLLIFLSGSLGILSADAQTAQTIANSTIERITLYVTNQMPGIVIADVAGAIVGTIGGAIISMVNGG